MKRISKIININVLIIAKSSQSFCFWTDAQTCARSILNFLLLKNVWNRFISHVFPYILSIRFHFSGSLSPYWEILCTLIICLRFWGCLLLLWVHVFKMKTSKTFALQLPCVYCSVNSTPTDMKSPSSILNTTASFILFQCYNKLHAKLWLTPDKLRFSVLLRCFNDRSSIFSAKSKNHTSLIFVLKTDIIVFDPTTAWTFFASSCRICKTSPTQSVTQGVL